MIPYFAQNIKRIGRFIPGDPSRPLPGEGRKGPLPGIAAPKMLQAINTPDNVDISTAGNPQKTSLQKRP
jgi:hypothetical protein